jgi:hypothetical protein
MSELHDLNRLCRICWFLINNASLNKNIEQIMANMSSMKSILSNITIDNNNKLTFTNISTVFCTAAVNTDIVIVKQILSTEAVPVTRMDDRVTEIFRSMLPTRLMQRLSPCLLV